MKGVILHIYDYLKVRGGMRHTLLAAITIVLVFLVLGQTYKEDIADFLPLGNDYQKAMKIYQQISGANHIFITFQPKDTTNADADEMVEAISHYEQQLNTQERGERREERGENTQKTTPNTLTPSHWEGWGGFQNPTLNLTSQIDIEQFATVADFAYTNIPYFLTDADIQRIDSTLSTPGFVGRQMEANKQTLMLPVSSLFSDNMERDPLNLFTPVVAKLQQSAAAINYETYGGYIFTPDMQRAIVMVESPFGTSETEHNAQLLDLLQTTADSTLQHFPQLDIRFVGAPVVAVGNARQIKADSMLSVSIAVVFIVLLLFVAFRSTRNLLLIVLSIAWGWLFAMGAIALFHNSVSVIVIGISSIILGIAVNYPLHLIAHLHHTPDIRTALKEIVTPLLVGNITTVGAFLALVPLKSTALRDLGLFSSFLLIGTIVFVLVFLPHWVKRGERREERGIFFAELKELQFFRRAQGTPISHLTNNQHPSPNSQHPIIILLLTCIFGYFSLKTSFDPDISHINYMTQQQKDDMESLQALLTTDNQQSTLYLVSESSDIEQALDASLQQQSVIRSLQAEGLVSKATTCSEFITPRHEQARRIEAWQTLVQKHGQWLEKELKAAARQQGFAESTFDPFLQILHANYVPQSPDYFNPLAQTAFKTNICTDSLGHSYQVIDQLSVSKENIEKVSERLKPQTSNLKAQTSTVFDIGSMNTAIANNLTDDFNYIGWACGLIVFIFLWITLGSIELALLTFLPMAISWIWILGIMNILGIQFNIVNVILATFIFGQGDDYTIFITEGCQYEYAYRRKMIANYKRSIIISALIMFIGIGALIFAKHPALRSLAQVTIIGMGTVVLMAYIIPPLIFRWLVTKNGQYRKRPITLRNLLSRKREKDIKALVLDRYRYKGRDIFTTVKRNLHTRDNYTQWTRKEISTDTITILNSQYGEFALLMALAHPDKQVIAYEADEDMRLVATYSAEGIAPNLTFIGEEDKLEPYKTKNSTVINT